jgi:Holliday junction resolvase-like predicted endonuclease
VKTHAGKVDLFALSASGLVYFIKVKVRPDARAAESMGAQQKARIARMASLYLTERPHLAGAACGSTLWWPRFPRHFRDVWRSD